MLQDLFKMMVHGADSPLKILNVAVCSSILIECGWGLAPHFCWIRSFVFHWVWALSSGRGKKRRNWNIYIYNVVAILAQTCQNSVLFLPILYFFPEIPSTFGIGRAFCFAAMAASSSDSTWFDLWAAEEGDQHFEAALRDHPPPPGLLCYGIVLLFWKVPPLMNSCKWQFAPFKSIIFTRGSWGCFFWISYGLKRQILEGCIAMLQDLFKIMVHGAHSPLKILNVAVCSSILTECGRISWWGMMWW